MTTDTPSSRKHSPLPGAAVAKTGKRRRIAMTMFVAMAATACGTSELTNESVSTDVASGDEFVDPEGTYTITISPDWNESSGVVVSEIESWTVAAPNDGFVANVNVLTQDAPGVDLAAYMELSTRGMGSLELIEQTTLTGANANELGLLEYKGVPPGSPTDRPLHFLAAVDVRDGVAIVATLTTEEADFEALRSGAEPFLKSLQAT